MKKLLLLLLVLVGSNAVFSQNLNSYKYAYIPSRFSELKDKNMYNLNVLSKLFMQKYGFETYMESDVNVPQDFLNNNCNKIFVDLDSNSNMFITKVKVVLKDCKGNVLVTSREGSSRDKDNSVAYNEAIRIAFASLNNLNYKYVESKEIVKQEEVIEQPKTVVMTETTAIASGTLYAQPIQNGFQLINSEPKVVMKIYKTSNTDIYAAVRGNVSGVFIPKGSEWFFEYYQNDKLISEKVDVKF